jgi:plasmid stabilization system protein ParE
VKRIRIQTTADVRRQVKDAAAWWRENRPEAPELFWRELSGALDLLRTAPLAGATYNARGVRRVLMPQTRYQVFYRYEASSGRLSVMAVWSSLRGKGPPLRNA